MDTMFYKRKIALNKIFKQLYSEKNKIDESEINTADSIYKNFVNENTEKLKEIFKSMGFKIEEYKNENGKYEIPIIVAEIFKIYLNENSSKGSFISKIRGKKFLEITYKEKEDFINKVVIELRKKFKDYPNANSEIDYIYKSWIGEAKYNEIIKDKIIETELIFNMLVESAIITIGSVSELDGLVSVCNVIDEEDIQDDFIEDLSNFNDSKVPYNLKLTQEDRVELINYLRTSIADNMRQWKHIVDIACELRENNIDECCMNDSDFVSSDELVELAIKEYKKEIKMKNEIKQVTERSDKDIKEDIKDIKLEMEFGKR